MKKILVLLGIAVLCLGLLLYSFSGSQPSKPTESTTLPTDETEPPTLPPAGQVRFVCHDPDLQPVWEQLAAEFTKQTGLQMTVTANADTATLFTLTEEDDLTQWAPLCADLSCTDAYSQLASWDLVLQRDGKVCGIPADVECFGLVYNGALLAQAGYTNADINSFADLQRVVRSITANRAQLGFAAFAAPDLTGSFVGHLSGLGADLRPFWDLYIQNTNLTTQTNSLNDLLSGKAVFYPAATGDYEAIATLGDHQLEILPLYTGGENQENGILHVEVKRYFCVRADAAPEDQEAALTFLRYLVHPREDGTVPIDDLGLLAPYRQATFAGNKLEASFRAELASGRACKNCAAMTPKEGLAQALADYAAAPTDDNWAKVLELL